MGDGIGSIPEGIGTDMNYTKSVLGRIKQLEARLDILSQLLNEQITKIKNIEDWINTFNMSVKNKERLDELESRLDKLENKDKPYGMFTQKYYPKKYTELTKTHDGRRVELFGYPTAEKCDCKDEKT